MSEGSILIVDSDRVAVRQLTGMLSDLPLSVHVAFTRSEAVDESLRCSFDLCLIAHGLSDGSGVGLFTEFLARRGQPMGVLLSRHADLRVIVEALDAGFDHIISHPVDSHQIRLILSELFPDTACICESDDISNARATTMNIELPDLRSIASLTMSEIRSALSNADLIRIIRSVDYPFAGKERLEFFDRDTLERVVCLVRRWGQQRLSALSHEQIATSETTTPVNMAPPTLMQTTSMPSRKVPA